LENSGHLSGESVISANQYAHLLSTDASTSATTCISLRIHQEILPGMSSLCSLLTNVDALKRDQAAIIKQIQLHTTASQTVVCNQKRLRDNLEKLTEQHANSKLVKRYLDDMNRDEDEIIAARKSLIVLEAQQDALREQCDDLVKRLKRDAGILKKRFNEIHA
jgi:DNA repair exonuclease SbcCD ATPase subunit